MKYNKKQGGIYMNKIIAIQGDIIKIGTDNGGIKEVRRAEI